MQSMAETDQVLKVDVAGRVWTPRGRREDGDEGRTR